MATLGDLVVNMVANNAKFNKGMKQSENRVKTFSSTAVTAFAKVGGALALIGAAKSAVEAARVQAQDELKLGAVLKATGHAAGLTATQIKDYASELQGVTNFGDEATISAAAMLATFKNIKGDQFRETLAAAQDMSSVLDTDLKSSVLQLGKALNDPTVGLTALTRSGVTFTEQQKIMIKTLQQSGDLLGAQTIILGELSSEFGGAAEAMADNMTQFENRAGDVAETVGNVLAGGANLFMDMWQFAFDVVGAGAEETGQALGNALGTRGINDVWNPTLDTTKSDMAAADAIAKATTEQWKAEQEIAVAAETAAAKKEHMLGLVRKRLALEEATAKAAKEVADENERRAEGKAAFLANEADAKALSDAQAGVADANAAVNAKPQFAGAVQQGSAAALKAILGNKGPGEEQLAAQLTANEILRQTLEHQRQKKLDQFAPVLQGAI